MKFITMMDLKFRQASGSKVQKGNSIDEEYYMNIWNY